MDRIHGQTHALDQLHAQLASGRVHHAQIFHGPAGVGKFTTALAFAKVLLCHDPVTDLAGRRSACGGCPSCLAFRIDSEEDSLDAFPGVAHPDLHVVNKELARYSDDKQTRDRKLTSIPVNVLRTALIEPAYLGAQLNHGKVFIVDEAELLNPAGQNALLKTLEEPPTPDEGGGTTIILVTSNEDRLLPTIRSRCQRIAFVPLPNEVLDRYLQEHAETLEPVERSWLVGFAHGSLGRAKLVLDYKLTEWARVVLAQLEQMAMGRAVPSLGADMAERINGFAEAWVKNHQNASKEAANKLAAGLMFSLIATYAQEQLDKLAEHCDPADPESAEAQLLPWVGVIDALGVAESRLGSNVNLGLTCDGLASAIALSLRERVMS
ncbi:DNA polymerase III subunit [Algisphaera agarilytica]|uniref:DNA polymerase-3 subunit delta n=1 Tax=Algisphaera agarilytica TaxID=1385975 RepID=A0A7X0H6B7_9BACT|nr:DNA polymerase III subunit [Algisphaera agarilytica]MBB6430092.1 DNA polymerase-3 subunit delta' [Algisphaera agarilytica]